MAMDTHDVRWQLHIHMKRVCVDPATLAGQSMQTKLGQPSLCLWEVARGRHFLEAAPEDKRCWHGAADCQSSLVESVRRAMLICFSTIVGKNIKLTREKSNSWQVFALHILKVMFTSSVHSPNKSEEWLSHMESENG